MIHGLHRNSGNLTPEHTSAATPALQQNAPGPGTDATSVQPGETADLVRHRPCVQVRASRHSIASGLRINHAGNRAMAAHTHTPAVTLPSRAVSDYRCTGGGIKSVCPAGGTARPTSLCRSGGDCIRMHSSWLTQIVCVCVCV